MEYATTDDGITIGSNTDTQAELQAALVETPPVVDTPADDDAAPVADAQADAPVEPKADESTERNPDGTFKAKPKPRNDPQARIDQAIAKQREAERERDQLRTDLAAARTQKVVDAPKPPVAAQPDAADPEPKEDDFTDYRLFVKAQARWEARQEYKQLRQADLAAKAEAERGATWQTRLVAARAKTPDFDTRVNPALEISAPMRALIADSEVGPELVLHLSEHPDLAQRLLTLHPIQVIREMGKLEARLEAAPSTPAPTPVPVISKAKPPIKVLGSSPPVADDADGSDDESVDAHIARENAKERRSRR